MCRALILILLCMTFAGLAHCQSTDSLRTVLTKAQGKDRISTLTALSFAEAQNNPQIALDYAQEAANLSEKLGIRAGLGNALHKIAVVYRFQGYYERSLHYSDSALSYLSEKTDQSLRAAIYSNMGVDYRAIGDYEKALEYFQKAIDLHKSLGQNQEWATVLNLLGVMYMYLEDYPKALDYYDQALARQRETGNRKEMANLLNNYAIVYANQGLLDSSLAYFQRSFEIELELGNRRGMSEGYNNIGGVYYYMGDVDKAIDEFRKSYAIDSSLGDYRGQIATLNNIAEIYTETDNPRKALAVLDRSLAMARKINSKSDIQAALSNTANAHAKLGNFEQAFNFLQDFIIVRDSVLGESSQSLIAEMETRFLTKETEQQLRIKELEIQENQLALAQRRNTIIGLGVIIVLLSFAGWLVYRYQKARKATEVQAIRAKVQENQLNAVIDATELERRRIAKELHDGIGQQLSSLKLGISNLSTQIESGENPEPSRLMQLQRIADQSAAEVRVLSHQMMPKTLIEVGLAPALRDMFAQSFELAGIAHGFEEVNADRRFDPRIEVAIYRIAQELTSNIIKHAAATEVQAELICAAGQISLLITDNGKGLNKSIKSGLGIQNMESRAQQVNGVLLIESGQPQGTAAHLRIKLVA